jgi:cytoskeleton protein RodZ
MENEQTSEHRSSVGSLLRATRLRAGITLDQISTGLRIRQAYIAAIEDSNYQALPGAAYAAGFVRAYAEFLSLDSEEVVRRFRSESAGAHASSQLRFPSPLSDRGIPGAALMFVGIVVATVAYGGWYLTTSENNVVTELVGPLPDRLAALLRSDPDVAGVQGDSRQPTAESASQGVTATDGISPAVASASSTASDDAAAQSAPAEPAPEPALANAAAQEDTPAVSATPAADMTVATAAASNTPSPVPAGPRATSGSSSTSTSTATNTAAGTDVARPVQAQPPRIETATTTPPSPVVMPAPVAPTTAALPPSPAAATMPAPTVEAPVQVPDVRAVTANSETATTAGTAAGARADAQPIPPTATRVAAPADAAPRPQPVPGNSQRPPPSAAEPTQGVTAAARPAASAPPERQNATEPTVAALPAAPLNPSPAGAATGSRITVRAKMPSWIQVRDDARNELLVTRMMREGDTYPVPNQPGLTLMTGNAGALEILVDGTAVPAVGPLGAVRRNVALDAKRLLDGTAVSE